MTLKKHGKQDRLWRKVRASWVRLNPPTHEGHYVCGICGKTVHISDMELDHVNPRSGSPESIADFSNLQPSHSWCNQRKGSRRVQPVISPDEYELRRLLNL